MSTAQLESTLPSTWYRDPAIFRTEKERIFCREWIAVCREEELPKAGDHLVLDVLGESVLLVRNREGGLRAFYNVCRHRGSRLCRTPQETAALNVALPGGGTGGRLIVCPYHQWSYDFNGALLAAPHLSAAAGFKKQDFHLYPVGVEAWGGFVFLNLTPADARPLSSQLDGIPERLQRPTGKLFARTTMSATTAAGFIRSSAPSCRRSARPGAATWIGAAGSLTARVPTRSLTAEPRCGAHSPVWMRTNRYDTKAHSSTPIYS